MKVYTCSQARAKLAAILEEVDTDEVIIKRRKGASYVIVPQLRRPRRSPFDVAGLNKGMSKEEIVDILRGSRDR